MGALIKFEISDMPDVLLVGKAIRHTRGEMAKGDNPIPAFWSRCFADGTFPALEAQGDFVYNHGYAGVMTDWDSAYNGFCYVVGMLMKPGADVPQGFVSYPLDATRIATGWIQGKDAADVGEKAYAYTEQAVYSNGYRCNQMKWCMELFTHPRYTTPDENGNIIMDYCLPVVQRDPAREPSVEDIMRLALPEDAVKPALDFAAFLRDAGFQMDYNPREYGEGKWSGALGGTIGDSIGYMYVGVNPDMPPWTIWLNTVAFVPDNSPQDEDLKALVWEHVSGCTRCHPDWANCGGGERVVLGRRFERLCHSPLAFCAPDAPTLERLQKLLLRIRQG